MTRHCSEIMQMNYFLTQTSECVEVQLPVCTPGTGMGGGGGGGSIYANISKERLFFSIVFADHAHGHQYLSRGRPITLNLSDKL